MTKAQAMKLARGKWGKNAHIRDNPRAPTGEQRDQAGAALKVHRANKPTPPTREWRQEHDRLLSTALGYRFAVGYLIGDAELGVLGFSVQGQGDSWEEACRKAGLL